MLITPPPHPHWGGGTALKFNGSNAYLEYKIKDDLLLTDDFTISLQIRNAGISVSSQAQIYFNGIDGQYNFQYENIRVPSFHLYHFYNNAAINIDKMGWAVSDRSNGTYQQEKIENSIPGLDSLQNFHLAVVHTGGITRIAVNGIFCNDPFTISKNIHNKDVLLYTGWNPWTGATHKYSNFTLDDVCIIKGRALWTSDFTPPTKYLPDRW